MKGFLCTASAVYEYNGWRFEYGGYGGPWPLHANSDAPQDIDLPEDHEFWQTVKRFQALAPEEREEYLVLRGGCIEFE